MPDRTDVDVRQARMRLLAGEALAGRELARLALRAPWLVRGRRGRGEPVVLLPGLGASDVSNAALRGYLRGLGYDAHGWGLGRNRGDVRAAVPDVARRVRDLFDRRGERVHLIGWSLGGVVARGVARKAPEAVAQIITYGSPILDRTRLRVPITVIYSRADGIVPWRSCIDDFSADVENLEVRSAHLGMGIDPDVWRIVTERLARHAPR
jgi:alpha-beta hydrolase superfamily lysophospholipase